ncbi:MAG: acetoacetate decarboxylase family protein [bacterium]
MRQQDIFSTIKSCETVSVRGADVTLPVTYRDAVLFAAAYTVSARKLAALLPTRQFKPMIATPGRAVMMVAAMNYIESSLGPHGEASIAFPVIFNAPSIPIFSALFEMSWPGAGLYARHLPVTTETALAAREEIWKFPGFLAEMNFTDKPGIHRLELGEKGKEVLTFTVRKTGRPQVYTTDWRTYTVAGDEILVSTIYLRGKRRVSNFASAAELKLGDHPVCDEIKGLDPSPHPIMSYYFVYVNAFLPAPERRYPLKRPETERRA